MNDAEATKAQLRTLIDETIEYTNYLVQMKQTLEELGADIVRFSDNLAVTSAGGSLMNVVAPEIFQSARKLEVVTQTLVEYEERL